MWVHTWAYEHVQVCTLGRMEISPSDLAGVAAWAGAGAGIWASPLTVDHYYLPLDRQPKYQVPSAECAPTPHPYSVKPIAAAGHTRAQGTHMRWQ